MKFFIPAADGPEQTRRVYAAIKTFLGEQLGATFSPRRIQGFSYVHNTQRYNAQVGKVHTGNGELVVAILHEPQRRLFHVCTENRGVARGMSILVGEDEVGNNVVTDFDD